MSEHSIMDMTWIGGIKEVKNGYDTITFTKAKLATWVSAPNKELTIRCSRMSKHKILVEIGNTIIIKHICAAQINLVKK